MSKANLTRKKIWGISSLMVTASVGMITLDSAHAITPKEYCASIAEEACQVLNVEPLSGDSLGKAQGNIELTYGQSVPLQGQKIISGQFTFSGRYSGVRKGSKSISLAIGPDGHKGTVQECGRRSCSDGGVTNNDLPKGWLAMIGSGRLPDSSGGTVPHNNYTLSIGNATCNSATCSLSDGEIIGSVPIMKKVCREGKFEVIFKQQLLSKKSRKIAHDDCSE